ncbi:MAG: 50S ribosomal protein L24 [Candidatus Nanohaloarchaea archaeon]
MVQRTENWSSNWKSSKNPTKQRKYRNNAPMHVKDKLVSAHLDGELREELGTRNISLRTGDRVEVMRGDDKGTSGIVNRIDREEEVIFIDGLEGERQDGSKIQKPVRPSNVKVTALNVEDVSRIEKFEVEDVESIQVDEEELEVLEEDEENEMMQRMQQGESSLESSEEEIEEEVTEEVEETVETEEVEEETEEETETSEDYDDVVGGTISDAKDMIGDLDSPDWDALIEAEKSGKNRKTMIEYLENQKE